jgi:acetoin utilization protein AcuB
MTIASIMSREVFRVRMDDSVWTIREIFDHAKFHHLLVMEKRKLVGVISDRDLLKAVSPFLDTISERERDLATLNRRAHQIMSRRPVTVAEQASVEDAVSLLLENDVSCLPVVSRGDAVVGIVTWKDVLKALFHDKHSDRSNSD